jgi:hypothetical protein
METYLGTRWMGYQLHDPAALPPGEEPPHYRLQRKLDGSQSRSGRCQVQKNLLPLLGIESWPTSP